MSEIRQLHLNGALGVVRTETVDGREHLIVPCVALMQGVIHAVNAETPEFVSMETLADAAESWNGKPVTLGHPARGGKQCSANDPEVLRAHGIGVLRNSKMNGTRLGMEALVDVGKLRKLGQHALEQALRAGKSIEVSVGAMVNADQKAGTWLGKAFKAAWRKTVGDHLAFLPDGRGACSMEMGCGTHRAAMHLVTAEAFVLLDEDEAKEILEALGGKGSGNFDHAGRPGEVGGSAHRKGDRVTISNRHHDKSLHGKSGTIKSSTTSAEGKPTHYVKTDEGRGQFVHADELDKEKHISDIERPTKAKKEKVPDSEDFHDFEHGFHVGKNESVGAVKPGDHVAFHTPNKDEIGYDKFSVIEDRDERVLVHSLHPDFDKWRIKPTFVYNKKDLKRLEAHDPEENDPELRAAEALETLLGSRHSKGDMATIQAMHDHTAALGAKCDRANYKMMEEKKISNIRHEGGRWILYSTDGTRRLGSHNTEAEAEEQQSVIDRRLSKKPGSCECGGH